MKSTMKRTLSNFTVLILSVLPLTSSYSQIVGMHLINKYALTVGNYIVGGYGSEYPNPGFSYWIDFGGEYPKKSSLVLAPSLWFMVGAVVGADTLVSSQAVIIQSDGKVGEFQPDPSPLDNLVYHSTLDSTTLPAISEEDWVATIIDTSSKILDPYGIVDWLTRRPHKPLYLRATISSYAWSYGYAEDFVLINYEITNIGNKELKEAYFGLVSNPIINFAGSLTGGDLVCGFLPTYKASISAQQCAFSDTVNIAWTSSNDGDPIEGTFTDIVQIDQSGNFVKSTRHVLGISLLNTVYSKQSNPFTPNQLSYNWATILHPFNVPFPDYGPQRREHFRDFGTEGTGLPLGDRNKYHLLKTPEIDFPSIYTATLQRGNPEWADPPAPESWAKDIADGTGLYNFLSIGPYDLPPGASISVPVALVAGENFHVDPNNGANLPNNPDEWMKHVDFTDLVKNTLWAQWLYDNPGVDTDGDGYAGDYHVCVIDSELQGGIWVPTYADTIWYRGDGVPDWKGAGPPPAPYVTVTPILNGVKVTFNGEKSETEKDIFSRIIDFEGYRVYYARDSRATSYSRAASYDHADYDIWVFNKFTNQYDLKDIPFPLDSLRCRYGSGCTDSAFDPLSYTTFAPYRHPLYPDSIYYFSKHDFNASELGTSTPIKKVYPNIRDPRTIPADQLTPDDYTEEGHLKFFEYECEITGLLSTVPYWVNVTAFDFGSPKTGLSPLETSVTLNAKEAFPLNTVTPPDSSNLKVYIYPNPYRIDGNYRDRGFEGRTREDFPDDKVRQVNFANLPYRCTIRVYTLDGDLVVEKAHDADPSDPTGRHDYWSLINRNRQIVVSGLYYWTVEEPNGKVQMGKLMVIR